MLSILDSFQRNAPKEGIATKFLKAGLLTSFFIGDTKQKLSILQENFLRPSYFQQVVF
jgi:hypothetical protein